MYRQLIELWSYISNKRKIQFRLLIILMILSSLSEIISIGAVIPFLGVLSYPERIYDNLYIQPIIEFFNIASAEQLILPVTIIFALAVLFSGVIRISLLYLITRLSFSTGADLSIEIYRKTLYQKYHVHLSRNSSEVINGIINKTNTVINSILLPILTFISSTVILIGIVTILMLVNTTITILTLSGFATIYLLIVRYTRAKLKGNSKLIAEHSTTMIKSLQEGLGGVRDVLINGSQNFYSELYKNADIPLRRASGDNIFITTSPKYIMETIGIVLISGVAYLFTDNNEKFTMVVPILGVMALGIQRILPMLQQVYSSYASMKSSHASFNDVLSLLGQSLPSYLNDNIQQPLGFKKSIELKDLSFSHSNSCNLVLKNINIKINKGDCVGFVGETGCGKSTLLDIIMGLLEPTTGSLTIDNSDITGRNTHLWQLHISHVPQNIYLSDSSIEENIAFGIQKDKIDREQVKIAAEQSQIAPMIESWDDGYDTIVGECGVRLSGGQRQRIGIARALYRKSDVLILDEATSALDSKTENSVMESINKLDKKLTILIIAHRISTLKNCDYIIELKDGHAEYNKKKNN